jgi:hypothetical protein
MRLAVKPCLVDSPLMCPRLTRSLLVMLACLAIPIASASAAVPVGFVGMMADGPFFYPAMNESGEMDQMVASGVESVRTVFNWATMQPCAPGTAISACPGGPFTDVGGVPTNFAGTDLLVAAAALHRLTVLPVVEYAPRWDALHPGSQASPPKSPGPFAQFVAALIGRYGPRGSFWAANPALPRVPIHTWQIWNEPDFTTYWSQQPFEPGYVRLLRATRAATKAADPGSKIMLAGLPNFSWVYLGDIYKIRGARKLFDFVAVHPYTATPAGVITIIGKVRAVMNGNGDRGKAIFATELSWPSAKGKAKTTFENATTEAGQARKLSQAVALLARNRRRLGLGGFYYYTWITNESLGASVDQFNFAGLLHFLDGQGTSPKPALGAFSRSALGIEGCHTKQSVATRCAG